MSSPLAIQWEPYRGEAEPVKVSADNVAKIILHPKHLEIKCFYHFDELIPGGTKPNFCKCHLLLKREHLELCRSVRVHSDDPNQEESPIIEIYGKSGLAFAILAKTHDIDPIFKHLRAWILSS
jgi:hypothetical protein